MFKLLKVTSGPIIFPSSYPSTRVQRYGIGVNRDLVAPIWEQKHLASAFEYCSQMSYASVQEKVTSGQIWQVRLNFLPLGSLVF